VFGVCVWCVCVYVVCVVCVSCECVCLCVCVVCVCVCVCGVCVVCLCVVCVFSEGVSMKCIIGISYWAYSYFFLSLSCYRSTALSKRFIHRMRPSASYVGFQYPVVFLRTYNSCLHPCPCLSVTCVLLSFLQLRASEGSSNARFDKFWWSSFLSNVCRLSISSFTLRMYECDLAKYLPLTGRAIKVIPVATISRKQFTYYISCITLFIYVSEVYFVVENYFKYLKFGDTARSVGLSV